MDNYRTVASFRIDSIKNEPLPSQVEGLPFSSEQLHELLENCPAVLVSPQSQQDSLPFTPVEPKSELGYQLQQPSPEHRRSFELIPSEPGQVWTDEYGNEYGALTLKGNNFSQPGILEHPTASEGFIAYGLQESSIIERVMKASKLLRSRNITTEYTIGLAEPKQYPWPLIDSMTDAYESVPLKEYKRRIITNYWENLSDEKRTPLALADLYKKFEDMTFYISLRATDTAYRLHDMKSEASRNKIYDQINKQQLLPEGISALDSTNPNDIDRYLEHVFCPRAGRNYARLHKDLAHGFAHGLNMSALGSIVDLDSINGAPLGFGDDEITDEDRAKDIADIISAVSDMQHFREPSGGVHFMNSYINETITQYESLESALEQLTRTLDALREVLESRDRLSEKDYADVAIAYAHLYLYEIAKATLSDESLGELSNEIKLHLYDAISNPEVDAAIDDQFSINSEMYVAELLEEHTNEISQAVYEGDMFDILAEIQESYTRPMSYVGNLMIDQVRSAYYSEITRHIITARQLQKSRENGDNVISDTIHRIVQFGILRGYDKELRLIAEAKVAELIPSLEERLMAASNFTVSQSLLPEYSSFANMGLNESHLWLCTDQVPLAALIDCVESSTAHIEFEELQLSTDINNTIVLPAHVSGVVTEEIISDSLLDGWSEINNEDQRALCVNFDKRPSYVLIRETLDQDTQRIRLQLSKDTLELLASTGLSLRQLQLASEQPKLF